MNVEEVTLGNIAIAGFLFDSLTSYNASLAKFRKAMGYRLDPSFPKHRDALLKWLNAWGCRHLSKDQHEVASRSILDWHRANSAVLSADNTPIWRLREREIETAADAYGSLKDRTGARRFRDGNEVRVPIGPTAASKILFAIRRKALMPWDEAMRISFECDGTPKSYFKYLKIIRDLTLQIGDLCSNKGFQIDDLPQRLGRPNSTVLALVNEYIWVTVTREVRLPSSATITQWASLG